MLIAFISLVLIQVCTLGVELSFADHLTTIWDRYGILFVVMAMLFPVFAYDTIKLSHRFAGPVYAIRFALRRLASGGDIPRVTFRKHDYWTELADDLNSVAEQLGRLKNSDATVVATGAGLTLEDYELAGTEVGASSLGTPLPVVNLTSSPEPSNVPLA
jgi:hypothetical protein